MKNLKVALLGVSHWHVPLYLSGFSPNMVKAVCDENIKIATEFSKQYSCPIYTDYKKMICEIHPDFVFAFAPHYKMKEVAEYLINAGIGFAIEKPAGLNGEEVEKLYNLTEQKGVFCAIPFVWRYSNTILDLKEKYLDEKIIHMSYKFVAGPPSRYLKNSPWMLSKKWAGGGCMTNLGVHFIDMALYLTESKNAEVLSSIYKYSSEYDIETYASAMLHLENGSSLLLETGYAYPMSEGNPRENRWTVVTKNGYNILADNNLELRKFGGTPQNITMSTDSDDYYPVFAKTSLENFIYGEKPKASLKEMLTVRKILDDMNAKAR